jgi:hypothetical protein
VEWQHEFCDYVKLQLQFAPHHIALEHSLRCKFRWADVQYWAPSHWRQSQAGTGESVVSSPLYSLKNTGGGSNSEGLYVCVLHGSSMCVRKMSSLLSSYKGNHAPVIFLCSSIILDYHDPSIIHSSNLLTLFTVDKEMWDLGTNEYIINFCILHMCKFDIFITNVSAMKCTIF